MSLYNDCINYLREMCFRMDLDPKSDFRRKKAYAKALESLKNAGTLDLSVKLPGVGPSISADFAEIEQKGICSKLKEMRAVKGAPPAYVMELLKIRNVGPKRAMLLFDAGIRSYADLEQAIREHRVVDPKLIQAFYASTVAFDRVSRTSISHAVSPIVSFISAIKGVIHVGCMGSFRRLRPDIRDIDVLVTLENIESMQTVVDSASKKFKAKITLNGKEHKANLDLDIEGTLRNLELTFCTKQEHGCSVLHFTGSKDFNIELRKIAERQGMKLNQYSIQNLETGKHRYFNTEEDVFRFLKLPYVPPECRDAYLFQEPVLPPILEVGDIVADLHVHTKSSDGSMTIKDVVKSASKIGYKAIGISDHSQGSGHGLDQDKAIERSKKIREQKTVAGVHLLSGVELDVKVNGSLDYDVQPLSEFNYVILAVHAQPDHQVESRMISAIEQIRKVHKKLPLIWAHPTGRLIGSRAEADVDWAKMFKFCVMHRVVLEINGQPSRLDLPDNKALVAKRIGCKFVVSSDSHGKELSQIDSAVIVARRALLTRDDIVNGSVSGLVSWLKGSY